MNARHYPSQVTQAVPQPHPAQQQNSEALNDFLTQNGIDPAQVISLAKVLEQCQQQK
jgi:hypothetical protein